MRVPLHSDQAVDVRAGLDVMRIREDFPILATMIKGRKLVYLDNAATTQKPRAVLAAVQQYYETENSNIHRGVHTLSERATASHEGARQTVCRFLNARSASEIIFVRGATEAINLVASSYGRAHVGEGDEVLITELEHHSYIVPWAITDAPCAFVTPWASVIMGTFAGFLVVGPVVFVERVLNVDDPVGSVSVHGVNGAWGMIALGLFADGSYGAGWNGVESAVTGLFGNASQLLAQGIAVVTVFVWAFGMHYAFFRVQDAVQGIRSSAEHELAGLDPTEMGVLAYPDMVGSGPLGEGGLGETHTGTSHPHPKPVGSEA